MPFPRPDLSAPSPLLPTGLAVVAVAADLAVGPVIQFPVFYVFPVALAAWHHGPRWALPLAVLMPLARLAYFDASARPWSLPESAVNAAIRIVVLAVIALLASRVARQQRALRRELALLRGLLPVCAHCKRIRNDADEWEEIEHYVAARSEARFTHGVCPACAEEHFGVRIGTTERAS